MARMTPKYPTKNLVGKKFNDRTVLEYKGVTKSKGGKSFSNWLCQCDCGHKQIVRVDTLQRSKTCQKCANKERGKGMRLPKGESAFNSLYSNNYQTRAKKYNIYFDLTKEQFRKLTSSNCFYCGAKPSQISHQPNQNGFYIYNGVDRVNNDNGYTFDNCVSCCKNCNYMKKAKSFDEFLQSIKNIYTTMKNKGYYNG